MQSRSLYFALSSASVCITFIEFVSDCCLWEKKKSTNQATANLKKQTPTNSNKPNSQTSKLERTVSLFPALTHSCAAYNLVFLSSSCAVDRTLNELKYLSLWNSWDILLAFLALYIWEFIYLPLAVCHLCHHTLSCSYCVHRCFMVGRECFPLPEPTFLPSQSFSTTFKNMFNFLKVITIYLGRIWIKRQDLISYQRKEVLWYMWCGVFLVCLGFFFKFLFRFWFFNISLIMWTELRHLFLVFIVSLIYY